MERQIVIVAPTFNEEENISAFLQKIPKNLKVVVADSHSKDKTAEIVKKLKLKNVYYLDVKKRGLGLGLIEGLNYAVNKLKADVLVTMEADLSCNPVQLPDFLTKLKKADVVLGSRYVDKGSVQNWSWWRRFLSRLANFALVLLSGRSDIHEFTNLYRVFTKAAWLKTRNNLKHNFDWLFVPAFVFEAINANLKIAEQPITYVDRYGGRSKMNTVSYTKNLLVYALRYRVGKLWTE